MKHYTIARFTRVLGGYIAVAILFAVSGTVAVQAADMKGARDHPMISRYEGSEIIGYKQDAFNEHALFTGKATSPGGAGKNPDSVKTIEGRVTMITYRNPAERTTLEVFRNYELALQEAGFSTLFSCKNEECGGRKFSHAVVRKANYIRIGESYGDQRYLAAKLSRDEGDIYVSLYVAMASVGGGPDFKRAITQLDVVEIAPMQENMVVVDADAMAKGIGEEGRIALYGILFDYDSAEIKPESKPTLDQIAVLMNDNPDLEIVVVGHTDNQGGLDYNMNLSERRARAVEKALVRDYGIAGKRLSAWGAGYLSPVASNRSEEGRAKNRRVELVEK
jgi:outer membrane protein OmpA-like peptidoglycan-associated protein